MKKLFLVTTLALALTARFAGADEEVRAAQKALQSAGFYGGELSGELNDDTRGALRRYQIRAQLEPSGNLTPETEAALQRETGIPVAPAAAAAPAPAPAAPVAVLPPAPSAPVPPPPDAIDPGYAALFAHSPFENASVDVQSETIRKAQVLLSEKRLYLGRVNGRPSQEFEDALHRFQAKAGLPKTGRLDIDTLAALRLLPIAKLKRPRVEPQPYIPQTPAGAVRGVPLD
ncbi:MAG: peptidoglycan-binding domain-containing protein [Chthoniobacteraceae bacterium]